MGLLSRKKAKTLEEKPKSTFEYKEWYKGKYPMEDSPFKMVGRWLTLEAKPSDIVYVMIPADTYYTVTYDEDQIRWVSNKIEEFKKQIQLHREQNADVMA